MPTQSALFQPIALRSLQLPNRIVVSPMCQYSAEQGCATDWHLIHLGQMVQGGAGLSFIEATAVSAQGRITPGCLGLYDDACEAALARVLHAIRPHARGAIGIQIGHAGRKASSATPWRGGQQIALADGGWQAVAPSAVPHRVDELAPRAMDDADLATLVADFVATTQRAARLGLDALELHAAHGYLLHEFLSPVSNHRDDAFGGSLAHRMRLPLQVFDAVRAAWPAAKPLGVRISATDWLEHTGQPSWTVDDSIVFAAELQARGCDWIDVSSAGVSGQQRIALQPGYQVHLADHIKRATGMTVMAVGLITEPAQAEAIVSSGQADLVALARGILWNPHWAWRAAAELGAQVKPPPQYARAAPREFAQALDIYGFGMR